MGMLKEFKDFAIRGNAVDMAVGIVVGVAFGKIVTSLVNDIIMPPIGVMMGNLDFSQLAITIQEKTATAEAIKINYGLFINAVLDFIIVAFAIFLVIRQMNRFNRKEEIAVSEPTSKDCPKCFSTIPIKATRCPNCTSELQTP